MAEWIDDVYREIKARWNRKRALPESDRNRDELQFLVYLMEVIERNTDSQVQ